MYTYINLFVNVYVGYKLKLIANMIELFLKINEALPQKQRESFTPNKEQNMRRVFVNINGRCIDSLAKSNTCA